MIEAIKDCPHCEDTGEVKKWVNKHRADDYYTPSDGFHVVCVDCEATSKIITYKNLRKFTSKKEGDFKNNPILCAKVSEEYDEYIEGIKAEVVVAWNRRV